MIDYKTAIKNTRKNTTRWSYTNASRNEAPELAVNRIESGRLALTHDAKFKCSKDDKIFTIGSCFAREIETFLVRGDYKVTSRITDLPEHPEFILSSGVTHIFDFFNRYNLGSMYQEIDSLMNGGYLADSDDLYYKAIGDQLFDDLHYTPAAQSTNIDGIKSRRSFIQTRLSEALCQSDVVILTLGLCESWYDLSTDQYLNVVSSPQMLRKYQDSLRFKFIGARENIELLDKIIAVLGDKKIIITVSPVPLEVTFTGRDVIEANLSAKSILHAAANEAAQNHSNVDYFPSYEMAFYSESSQVWKPDGRHVLPEMVQHIVKSALDTYFS